MQSGAIFEGLNPEQRSAVEAVRGPVCILAGAGSGKTTTITRRIANQVATRSFDPSQILAVTFTDKAAGEMRTRLTALGVEGVNARTFHSAALAQLSRLAAEPPGQLLPSKVIALRQIANKLPKPYNFRPAADLATEIEWAKNRRIGVSDYRNRLKDHEPPIPADLMAGVYKRYEDAKRERGVIDFEDLLELAIRMFRDDEYARERFQARYFAFTVDEYQDVNVLQQTLLDEWLGERDDLCAVGDDYQAIYGFTGASPEYLLALPGRFVNPNVVRLETNYRSTPQVLDVANKLVPRLGGVKKVLRAERGAGPEPQIKMFASRAGEIGFLIDRIRELKASGVALEEIAILYRLNFRSEDYEEALVRAAIPFQVRSGAFMSRQTARQMLSVLKRSRSMEIAKEVRELARRAGYVEDPGDDLGEQELTRQNDIARFIQLAAEFDDGTHTCMEFAADVEGRFGSGDGGRGVQLLTYHRAKGLEFEAVFLPRLEGGELPFHRSKTSEASAEERRLFYVGITRAKTHLAITWAGEGNKKVSPFVTDLMPERNIDDKMPLQDRAEAKSVYAKVGLEVELTGGYAGRIAKMDSDGVMVKLDGGGSMRIAYGQRVTVDGENLPLGRASDGELMKALKNWRRERATTDGVPAFVVFHDKTLSEIVDKRPKSLPELASISGVGDTKLERYGEQLIEVVTGQD